QLLCRGNNSVECNEIGNIKMTDRNLVLLRFLENVMQRLHNFTPRRSSDQILSKHPTVLPRLASRGPFRYCPCSVGSAATSFVWYLRLRIRAKRFLLIGYRVLGIE